MKIIEKPNIISPGMLVAGIGFFDGVHLGHQALIGNIVQTARERNMSSAVVTFRSHPRQVLHNNYCPHLINSFEERMQHLSKPANYTLSPNRQKTSNKKFYKIILIYYL